MTFHDAIRVLRARWITLAAVTVVCAVIAAAYAFLATPEYKSSTNLFIATPAVENAEQAYAASRFSQGRAISYTDLITSESLATRTVTRLHLGATPRDLAQKISVSANPDSVVLTLSVTDPSSSDAVLLANSLADDFVRMVQELETPSGGGPPAARAVVVQRAVDARWVSPDRQKIIAFGVIAGLLLGGVVALLQGSRKKDIGQLEQEVEDGDSPTDAETSDVLGRSRDQAHR